MKRAFWWATMCGMLILADHARAQTVTLGSRAGQFEKRGVSLQEIDGDRMGGLYSDLGFERGGAFRRPISVSEYGDVLRGKDRSPLSPRSSQNVVVSPAIRSAGNAGMNKLFRVVDPTEVPVISRGIGDGLPTLNDIPGCGELAGRTTNEAAAQFVKRFPETLFAVAMIVGVSKGSGELKMVGTAFLVEDSLGNAKDEGFLVSAGHVFEIISSVDSQAVRRVGRSSFEEVYAVFDAFGGRLPMALKGYEPSKDAAATRIPADAVVGLGKSGLDIGVIRAKVKRGKLRFAAVDAGATTAIAVVGVPDRSTSAEGVESRNEEHAYGICGRSIRKGELFPRELRLSTGSVRGRETMAQRKGWLLIDANTQVGNSGSPVLDAESGDVVGVLVAGENSTAQGFNYVVPASAAIAFLSNTVVQEDDRTRVLASVRLY